jgi:hypothetical protein
MNGTPNPATPADPFSTYMQTLQQYQQQSPLAGANLPAILRQLSQQGTSIVPKVAQAAMTNATAGQQENALLGLNDYYSPGATGRQLEQSQDGSS